MSKRSKAMRVKIHNLCSEIKETANAVQVTHMINTISALEQSGSFLTYPIIK